MPVVDKSELDLVQDILDLGVDPANIVNQKGGLVIFDMLEDIEIHYPVAVKYISGLKDLDIKSPDKRSLLEAIADQICLNKYIERNRDFGYITDPTGKAEFHESTLAKNKTLWELYTKAMGLGFGHPAQNLRAMLFSAFSSPGDTSLA